MIRDKRKVSDESEDVLPDCFACSNSSATAGDFHNDLDQKDEWRMIKSACQSDEHWREKWEIKILGTIWTLQHSTVEPFDGKGGS